MNDARVESLVQAFLRGLLASEPKARRKRALALVVWILQRYAEDWCRCAVCLGKRAGTSKANVSVVLKRLRLAYVVREVGRGHTPNVKVRHVRQWQHTVDSLPYALESISMAQAQGLSATHTAAATEAA